MKSNRGTDESRVVINPAAAGGVGFGGAGVYDSFADAATRRHATSLSDDFERYVNLGDDRNVRAVFVRGRAVVGAAGIERRILSHANLGQESSASDAQPLVAGS